MYQNQAVMARSAVVASNVHNIRAQVDSSTLNITPIGAVVKCGAPNGKFYWERVCLMHFVRLAQHTAERLKCTRQSRSSL